MRGAVFFELREPFLQLRNLLIADFHLTLRLFEVTTDPIELVDELVVFTCDPVALFFARDQLALDIAAFAGSVTAAPGSGATFAGDDAELAFGARPSRAIPVALLAPILLHLVFYKLLRVPLPAGLVPMPW